MFKVLSKQMIAPHVKRLDVLAADLAGQIQPGQFVMVMPDERSEKIPLAVVETDLKRSTISMIVQEVGATTKRLGDVQINEEIFSIIGPLGRPSLIGKQGVVVCIATGIGIAQMLPLCRALRKLENKVIGIIGATTRRALVLEAQMRLACNKVLTATEDGSFERRGLATDVLKDFLKKEKVDRVYAIGSVEMMRAVCEMTKQKKIPTRVTLKPAMVDGTGLCGSCRVKVGSQILLACVDGPEFDGQEVDFDDLDIRMKAMKGKEGWDNLKPTVSRQTSGSKTLTKFLSGLLKN